MSKLCHRIEKIIAKMDKENDGKCMSENSS